MIDVIGFFIKIIENIRRDRDFTKKPLEYISSSSGQFAYLDDRKRYYKTIALSLKKAFESSYRCNLLETLILSDNPSKLKTIASLFPKKLHQNTWKKFRENFNSFSATEKQRVFNIANDNIVEILKKFSKGADSSGDNNVLGSLLGFNFKSSANVFPDFLFTSDIIRGELQNGSILELKDSKGSNVSSFNLTIPTKYKTLDEINAINGTQIVSKLANIIDYPHSKSAHYGSHGRTCFYFVRTNNTKAEKMRISIVEGSFFETIPKEKLIAETMKAIAREHLGNNFTPELEAIFEKINDQSIIARSRSDIATKINGMSKKASVSPRFRIMSEVATDGNPHLYPEIPEKTFNLILQVNPSRDKDKIYIEVREKIISSVVSELNSLMAPKFIYNKENNKISNGEIILEIKEIAHKRNGLHLVFQYHF